MMNVLSTIVSFTIVLGIIVLIHEFGHFIAARMVGVRVETFSFGFGKRLFGKKYGDTDFRVSLIPLGGYVKMAGEEEWDENNLKPDEFQAKNRGQKILILVAGSVMNLLLAYAIFTIINITGVEIDSYKKEIPKIGYVDMGSPAEKTGIRKGDIIRKIDGSEIKTWKDLELTIGSNPNSTLTVDYERDSKIISGKMNIRSISQYGVGEAGVYWDFKTLIASVNPGSPAAKYGIKEEDIITGINNQPMNYFELVKIIAKSSGVPLDLQISRNNKPLNINVTPRKVYFAESGDFNSYDNAEKMARLLRKKLPGPEFEVLRRNAWYRIISKDFETMAEAKTYSDMQGLPVKLYANEKGVIGTMMIAYSPSIKTRYGLFAGLKKSFNDCINLSGLVFSSFKKMIVGKLSPKQLSGPIEIAKFSGRALQSGLSNFFLLIAFISLQLGLVNLFPIPALDGGHLLIYTLEAIVRKEFSQKVKEILMNIGFALLISLMAFVILNDVAKLLPNGWRSFWPF